MSEMNYKNYQPMIEATRGSIVESIHVGAVAVSDASGNLVGSFGDPHTVTFLRSSAKPFQALPFIELGGAETFGLTDREVAVLCASHAGTDDHAAVIRGIQKKIGITEKDLLCGIHPPEDDATAQAMLLRGEAITPVRHNCSGKHTGMLAHALLRHLSIEDYINPEHPIQKTILQGFSEMCEVPAEQIILGTDGCSAPVFAIPLQNAALGYARLCGPDGLGAPRAVACRRITRAMTSNPDMIAGPGRFDTVIMQVGAGKILSKGGAEGYQALGLLPGARGSGSPALGITFKIADGDNTGRARAVASVDILRQLGALSDEQLVALAAFGVRPLRNWRKLPVGEIRPCFILQR
jgi:L-asparaginase II